MNKKRIEELAEQANLEIDPAYPDHNQKVLEQFAELIVRECVAVVDAARPGVDGIPASAALHIASKNIKAYFGVE